MTPLRTLPVRIAPLPGEALDSWLEALAYRMHMPVGDLLGSVGLTRATAHAKGPGPSPGHWMAGLQPHEASAITKVTGAGEAQVVSMTMAAYDGRALIIDPATRVVSKWRLWGRAVGSRYCPSCLAESSGRWSLAWRLGWSFACLRHQCLLADACPRCGRIQRIYRNRGKRPSHPADCSYAALGSTASIRCGADLREAAPVLLGEGHPALRVQEVIMDAIEAGNASFGVYAGQPTPSLRALADVKAIAAHALAEENAAGLYARLPADLLDLYQQVQDDRAPSHSRSPRIASTAPGRMSPSHAVVAAAGILAAVEVLSQPSIASAGKALRWLTADARARGKTISPTLAAAWGHETSSILNSVTLSSLKAALRPNDQLRYRAWSPQPSVPEAVGDRITVLARGTPSMLWPFWALRLCPPGSVARIIRAALSVLVLITGTRATVRESDTLLGSTLEVSKTPARILQALQDTPQWPHAVTALTRLSDYLAAQPAPIDYQRRRALDYENLLPSAEWKRICRVTGAMPGAERKELIARAYLTQRVSGLACSTPAPGTAISLSAFRTDLSMFPSNLFPELSAQLDDVAQHFLAGLGITGEPVAWQPPLSLIRDLNLPGTDPAAVDIYDLHQLINEGISPASAARVLETTTETVCAVLAEHPAPARPIINGQGSVSSGPRINVNVARLPRDELKRLYVQEGMTIRQIAAAHHIDAHTVGELIRRYEIPPQPRRHLAVTAPRAGFTSDWLRREYIEKGRSFTEIGSEADLDPSVLARWARKWGIPSRPRGGARQQAAGARRAAAAGPTSGAT